MKKCLIMPDSFKGTLSAMSICEIIEQQVLSFFPECKVHKVPIADGGEGTVDCFLYATSAEKISVEVHGAYNEPIYANYARMGNQAIIEMAQVAGLPQVEGRENPAMTTTYGVGELILHAARNGCKDIIIGLGGSCTNDAGVGATCALGGKFYDSDGVEFIPTGSTLHKVKTINLDQIKSNLSGCKISAMCDISNPMYGLNGAAYVFAPQKGADNDMVKELDENLRVLSDTIIKELGVDVSNVAGTGAAGAFGAGVIAFLGGELKSGITTVLDLIEFEKMANGADIIFTGEGRIDSQSLGGKAVIGIAQRAKRLDIPVVAVVGSIGDGAFSAYDLGVDAIFSINQKAEDFSVSRYKSKENLTATIDSILRLYKIASSKNTCTE